MTKHRLTGLELERRRLKHLREKASAKQRRKASESRLEVCPTCGRKHATVKHLRGALMESATAMPATSSEKGSDEKPSTDTGKASPGEKTSEESNSTPKATGEEK